MSFRTAAALFVLCLPICAETVRFKTSDGIEIVADWWPAAGTADAPTVVCLPMYRHTRSTYGPLVKPLHAAGIHVLALDLRGHGESGVDLAGRIRARDAAVFNAMHHDVAAAFQFLEREKACDLSRVGLIGASVGCSVAVDVAVRLPHRVRALVLLTPGSKYLGVNTLDHLSRWPGTAVWTLCSKEEERTSGEVIEKLGGFAGSKHEIVSGRGIHGTRMFGQVSGIEERIAGFLRDRLVDAVDLRVPQFGSPQAAPKPPGVVLASRRIGASICSLSVYAVGKEWRVGALVEGEFSGSVRFALGDELLELPLDTRRAPKGLVSGENGLVRGASEGRSWLLLTRDLTPHPRIALEFVPNGEKAVGIPGGGAHFSGALHSVHGR